VPGPQSVGLKGAKPTCPRCKVEMVQVAYIDSFGGQPALEAYECPKCKHIMSRLTEIHDTGNR
jgi:hypothetical protein